MAERASWTRIGNIAIACLSILTACATASPSRGGLQRLDARDAIENREATGDFSDWMSRHKNELKDLPLNRVTLLGSHDAASKDVRQGSPPATGYLTHNNKHLHRHATARDVDAARCQSVSIAGQLTSGVRYLDLRVAHQDGAYFGMHMWLSTPFFGPDSVMAQIKAFTAAHPDEVLILYFQHLYSSDGPMTEAQSAALFGLVERELPGLLIPKNDFSRLTYGEIWRGRGRIILMSGMAASLPFVWSDQALDSTWFDQQRPQTLVAALDAVVASWRAGDDAAKLRHLQAMTTTGEKLAAARVTNALIREKLAGDWRDAPISVVQVDDAAFSGIMPLLLQRLQ